MDIADTIVAKSDQLNAEDLIAGPITVQIIGVKRTSDDQPLSVEISGGHRPWKPCKTMRRLLILAWPDGAKKEGEKTTYDPTCWIGRSVTLMRDPQVKWAGTLVGGIRVSGLSDIKQNFEVALAESKGKKKLVTIAKIDAPTQSQKKQENNGLTLLQKYTKRLAELKTREEIEAAYVKFESDGVPKMDDETAQQIYMLFAKLTQTTQEPVI